MDVIKYVKSNMVGRMCDEQNNVTYLLEIVKRGGDGNYLEIGVLHGGTLCAAGLQKKEIGQRGRCYGIDPLDGYYMDYIDVRGCSVDPVTRKPVDYDTVKENITKFKLGRRCMIQPAKSNPYPLDEKLQFAVTYIDGDHWGDAPLKDWLNTKDRTEKYVVFSNHNAEHPAVMEACKIAANDNEWDIFLNVGITFVLKRRGGTWQSQK